jgi:hypothetical protein
MAPALLLDPAGSVSIEGTPVRISRHLSKDDAVQQLSAFLRNRADMKTGYEWLHCHNVSLGGLPAYFSLGFHRQDLEFVDWSVALGSVDEEISFLRDLLRQVFSRSFDSGLESFPWGEVWAHVDHKTGDASSGLRYVSRGWRAFFGG